MAAALILCVSQPASSSGRPARLRASVLAAASKPNRPEPSRGPGQAPLRMQTDEQRKFGYGGDGYNGGSGRGGGDEGGGGWEPGGSDDGACYCRQLGCCSAAQVSCVAACVGACVLTHLAKVNPAGMAILGVCGLWAFWEYRRPGGKLNKNQSRRH